LYESETHFYFHPCLHVYYAELPAGGFRKRNGCQFVHRAGAQGNRERVTHFYREINIQEQ